MVMYNTQNLQYIYRFTNRIHYKFIVIKNNNNGDPIFGVILWLYIYY
jgi:hypothetical protein